MTEPVVVKILRAFQPGDVVFVECALTMTRQTREAVKAGMDEALKGTGVRVVILEGGLKLAAREEVQEGT